MDYSSPCFAAVSLYCRFCGRNAGLVTANGGASKTICSESGVIILSGSLITDWFKSLIVVDIILIERNVEMFVVHLLASIRMSLSEKSLK